MFSLKQFKLLVDLYQFLPSKKNGPSVQPKIESTVPTELSTRKSSIAGRNERGTQFKTLPGTPLAALCKEVIDSRGASRGTHGRNHSLFTTEPMSESDKSVFKSKLGKLAQRLVDKFGKVSTAFRAFDLRTRGFVTFADFAYVIDQMKLGFERDMILQVFTYMDSDQNNQLKYRDFCNLCAEHGMQAGS
mmetsp:Transcript_1650/g.2286  ORF Transcript_1650/g.2286 Transcript_1650/m.2286 type:complete len:189 (+) Transcript_1650:198-764(+)|eukprot:CAMPEP_0185599822 /NCGR_PEP_ID=MMETSP0434-20130131/82968_1 /TAXON_ID=626734 ORGANISM="Favella taraikaensis, Strain Fe Narragansett Bay" /NCGR_SAMPLE_ID=MMETSP0434 /ASSEMBLY_ACC=CAM_ASM_000379 /LENGTH=188 /DNA_ID=CAMNT_0028229367 /DNA_START=799 /DNA_END=1365 /DNA_ORIENTATION=-